MQAITRRTVLRGIGAAIALPWLEAMAPAQSVLKIGAAAPKRIAFMYIPNGVIGHQWFPKSAADKLDLTNSLTPLASVQNDINVFSGLSRTYLSGEPHSQCASCWLTSAMPNDFSNGLMPISQTLDQVIAQKIGRETPFRSLELSCNSFVDNMEPKVFDSISWFGPNNDARSENDPKKVFNRLFGKSQGLRQSVLDTVLGDARSLRSELGSNDRRKLDEYLESVRSIEQRLSKQDESKGRIGPVSMKMPEEIPTNRGEYIRMMGDLMLLAFQTDQTRVASMMVGPERWETPQLYDGVFEKPVNHHQMTHDRACDEDVSQIDRFHVGQYAYLVNKMKQMREGDGSMLDNTYFVLGSGLGDGSRHSYDQLPIIVAGSGGNRVATGRHISVPKGTPLADLWLSLANNLGLGLERFADSQNPLSKWRLNRTARCSVGNFGQFGVG